MPSIVGHMNTDSNLSDSSRYSGRLLSASVNGVAWICLSASFPWDKYLDIAGVWWLGDAAGVLVFGTPLLNHLQVLEVNHLIVAGTTTSGCVRASVYDAFSYNFGVTIAQECVFDRFQTSHRVALHDMDAKYADVAPLDDVLRELDAVMPRPSDSAPPIATAAVS